MDLVRCFKDLFESVPDFKKAISLFFRNKNDVKLLKDCGFLNE